MPKLYAGVNNKARKSKEVYIGVNGVARKCKKIYVGDANGKARLTYMKVPTKLKIYCGYSDRGGYDPTGDTYSVLYLTYNNKQYTLQPSEWGPSDGDYKGFGEWELMIPVYDNGTQVKIRDSYIPNHDKVEEYYRDVIAEQTNIMYAMPLKSIFWFGQYKTPLGVFDPASAFYQYYRYSSNPGVVRIYSGEFSFDSGGGGSSSDPASISQIEFPIPSGAKVLHAQFDHINTFGGWGGYAMIGAIDNYHEFNGQTKYITEYDLYHDSQSHETQSVSVEGHSGKAAIRIAGADAARGNAATMRAIWFDD